MLVHLVKLITLGALWIAISRLLSYITRRRLEHELGAKPIRNVEENGLFGIRFGFKLLRYKHAGDLVDYHRTRYSQLPDPHVASFRMRVFGKKLWVTRDPENIKAMLATQFEEFGMGNRRKLAYPLLNGGIFVTEGKPWSHSRALLKPQFLRKQVSCFSILEHHFKLLALHVQRHDGRPFDLQELLYWLTADTATSSLFGQSCGALADFGEDGRSANLRFTNALDIVQEELSKRLTLQGMHFLSRTPGFKESLQIINDFADYYINKTLAMSSRELEKAKEDGGYVFLHSLCQETRDPTILRDELLNIFIAGRDTTASLLSFTLFELARNKGMWETLREEVNAQFGDKVDGITFESLKHCLFLKAVLNELLRMYPPVAINSRTVCSTTTLPRGGGHDGQSPVLVEKDDIVIYSVYAMHRNPDIYGKDAQVFDPVRWLDGRTKGIFWEYLPFNGGPRVCLGQQYGLTEASYVLVRLAQTFPNLSHAQQCVPYPPKLMYLITIKLFEALSVCML